MINILEIRPNPKSLGNGIDTYCQALRRLFKGSTIINVLPIENIKTRNVRVIHEVYYPKAIKDSINSSDVDAVHVNGCTSISVLQAIYYAHKYGKKIIYSAHWHPFEYLNNPFLGKIFFHCLLRPLIKKRVDLVFTINKEDTDFLSGIHENVIQIPHWINEEMVQEIDTIKKSKQILFVGRLNDSNKGIEHIYELPEGKYDIHCVGKGSIPPRKDITQHVNVSKEVLNKLYAESSLLVVPSKYEAFSYVTLEALLHNTPVLLTQNVRIADYLKNVSGVDAFDYQDYGKFVDKVELLIGQNVDVNKVKDIFSANRVRSIYETAILKLFSK